MRIRTDGFGRLRPLIIDPAIAGEGCRIGCDPRTLTVAELEALGVERRPWTSVIRAKCLDCCCGHAIEVRRCGTIHCALWPYRMGSNPFAAERSEEQRAAARESMRALHAKHAQEPENSCGATTISGGDDGGRQGCSAPTPEAPSADGDSVIPAHLSSPRSAARAAPPAP